ncbi:MAG: PD-(D/E)XK nuclease family protein, partial [Candidatus Omnitrophica bacterium]|nr:PD-(D/E)XK nuclease family protein [Candidatus Omnitrophota bacterium]
ILDVNENVLPHLNIYDPLIPREVMVSLNLDRLELEEEIQRYQFMRLISSAKEVHLVYQERADKERSRFVEELIWEKEKAQKKVEIIEPHFTVKVHSPRKQIAKTPVMIEILKNHTYSSSSINLYLRNPLEFYYQYVLGLREKEDLLDEPENRQVGTFIHGVLEDVFKPYVGCAPQIDEAFRLHFRKIFHDRFEQTLAKAMKSDAFLLKSVIDARMERFLQQEAEQPLRQIQEILFIEKKFEDVIPLSVGNVKFVYRMDRVDRLRDGTVFLIDYKAGSVDPMPKAIDKIEGMELSRESIFENVRSFQMPLYFFYLDKHFPNEEINAAFYNLRTLEMDCFLKEKAMVDRGRIKEVYSKALDFVMKEILDPAVPFDAPSDLW